METLLQAIRVFGTAADLARATRYTPQAISVAIKRGKVSDRLEAACRRAMNRQLKKAA
jgi:hypothetical protein